MCWFAGSLASCKDPSIVLEVLNFVLSPEVLLSLQNSIHHLLHTNIHALDLKYDIVMFYVRSVVRMLSLDFLSVMKDVRQLGHGSRFSFSSVF